MLQIVTHCYTQITALSCNNYSLHFDCYGPVVLVTIDISAHFSLNCNTLRSLHKKADAKARDITRFIDYWKAALMKAAILVLDHREQENDLETIKLK